MGLRTNCHVTKTVVKGKFKNFQPRFFLKDKARCYNITVFEMLKLEYDVRSFIPHPHPTWTFKMYSPLIRPTCSCIARPKALAIAISYMTYIGPEEKHDFILLACH